MEDKNGWVTIDNLAIQYKKSEDCNIYTKSCKTFLDKIVATDILPFSKGEMHFSDDKWDFSLYSTLNIRKASLCMYFETIPECYKDLMKKFAIVSIMENRNKLQTISFSIKYLTITFKYFVSKGITCIEYLDENIIAAFFEYLTNERKIVITTKVRYQEILFKFLMFYDTNIKTISNRNVFQAVSYNYTPAYKAWRENHKSSPIEEKYFDNLLSVLLKYMDDESNYVYYRSTAALIVLLSQVGLRICELLRISTDSMRVSESVTGEKLYYLYYESWKEVKGNNKTLTSFTYINEIALKAYNFLFNLPVYVERRKTWKIKNLYCGSAYTTIKKLPLTAKQYEVGLVPSIFLKTLAK